MNVYTMGFHSQTHNSIGEEVVHPRILYIACENIRFSSLFAAAKSKEKRMFSQATDLKVPYFATFNVVVGLLT